MRVFIPLVLMYISAPITGPDYRLSLSYYAKPIYALEWTIEIIRRGDEAFLTVNNFHRKTVQKSFPFHEYIRLVDLINSRGLWTIGDYYPANSRNGWYLVSVRTNGYAHTVKVEHGVPLTGAQSAHAEIIRLMVNTARFRLAD